MCKRNGSQQATLAPGSQRLAKTVVPEKYDLTLRPDLGAATFTGTAIVHIDVTEPVSEIVLHAAELLLADAFVTNDIGTRLTGTVTNGSGQALDGSIAIDALKDDNELAVIKFGGLVGRGRWQLHLSFSGILNDKLHGFYRSTYKDERGAEHVIAATQLCPVDARRAFPCFDEPELKASFAITLVVPESLTAISNGRLVSETLVPGSRQVYEENWMEGGQLQYICEELIGTGMKAVAFAPTMRMSTYLVAFVVGEFERSEVLNVHGTDVSVYHVPGKAHLAKLGLETAAASLEWYWKYFGINYATFADKLDLIAVPDFPFGAMENFGCVTFRETTLLVDEKIATVAEKTRVAEVVAHEIAHMWFGDLVTMLWWNGLWLNEAFATFMSFKCVDAWKPEWKLWNNFGTSRGAAFATDGLRTTRAIECEVSQAADALAMLDVITYEKGCSVLRMLEQFLGEDVFRDGIRHYLQLNQFGNAETTDLWDAIEHVAGRPVRQWMNGWIFQPGHPLVEVELSAVSGCITLRQSTFKYLPGASTDTLWFVPVKVRAQTAEGVVDMYVELDRAQKTVFLGEGIEWVVVNADGNGFFRSSYSTELADKVTAIVAQLSVSERYNFVNDLWAAVRAGVCSSTDYLKVVTAFSQEDDPNVLSVILDSFGKLAALLPDDQRETFAQKVRDFAGPIFARLGWTAADNETPQRRQLRGQVVNVLGTTGGDEQVRTEARALFASYKTDKASVPGDLVPAMVDIVAHTGSRVQYDEFKALRAGTNNPQEQIRFLYALAGFRDQELLREFLCACITDDVRTQDAPSLISALMANDLIAEEAWRFIKENWSQMVERFPETGFLDLVEGVTRLNRRHLMDDVQTFLAANPVRGGGQLVVQYLEHLHINVLFDEREGPALKAAFVAA